MSNKNEHHHCYITLQMVFTIYSCYPLFIYCLFFIIHLLLTIYHYYGCYYNQWDAILLKAAGIVMQGACTMNAILLKAPGEARG